MLFGDLVEPVPRTLGQTRRRKKEQADTLEETLAQLAVPLQVTDQLFPPFGPRQVRSGRNLLEIAQGFGEALGRGLTIVQLKRPAFVQHVDDVMTIRTNGV